MQDPNIVDFYYYLMHTLVSFINDEGYVGSKNHSIKEKRRLTHQCIAAMLESGFQKDTPVLQKLLEWMKKRDLDESDSDIAFIPDVIEASLRMGERDSELCKNAIDYLLNKKAGPIKYQIRGKERDPFFALWCSKILLYYSERDDCHEAVTNTIKYFASQYKELTGARDLSFLIALYNKRWPNHRRNGKTLNVMVERLFTDCFEGLFEVSDELKPRIHDLVENGLSQSLATGFEHDIYMSIISTSYVIENLSQINFQSDIITSSLSMITRNYFNLLFPAINHLSDIFPDTYHQIMLTARTLSAFAIYRNDDVVRETLPKILSELIERERNNNEVATPFDKNKLRNVLREWFIIDWEDNDQEVITGGISGSKIIRVKPKIKTPESSVYGNSNNLPLVESVIIKIGKKGDLDKERRNFETIPIDYRHLFASIPADTYKEIIKGELIEYLVIEDLAGFRTIREIITSINPESRINLLNNFIDFLRHFYSMPTGFTNSTGIIRTLYINPIQRSLEKIQEFKNSIKDLEETDFEILYRINEILRRSKYLEEFQPTAIHGDLHLGNVMVRDKVTLNSYNVFRLIDVETFSKKGDYVFDLGEIWIDIEESFRKKDTIQDHSDLLDCLSKGFTSISNQRIDSSYLLRLSLSKARSKLRLAEINSKKAGRMGALNPISIRMLENIFDEEINPYFSEACSLINSVYLNLFSS